MTPEELIQQLCDKAGTFPEAMDSPLVAAGVFGMKTRRWHATGKNVMRLRPTSGYDESHAEELALKGCGDTPPDEPVEIVVTLEPCHDRSPKGALPCDKRIAEFVSVSCRSAKRIVIGTIETGKGLRFLLSQGMQVTLLHGPAHERTIQEKNSWEPGRNKALRALEELKKSPHLQVISPAALDPINQNEHQRFLRIAQRRKERVGNVLGELKTARRSDNPFAALQRNFPDIFIPNSRARFQELFAEASAAPDAEFEEIFYDFVSRLVYLALNKVRNQNIERELRAREAVCQSKTAEED